MDGSGVWANVSETKDASNGSVVEVADVSATTVYYVDASPWVGEEVY